MELRFFFLVNSVVFVGSLVDGKGNCIINGTTYSYCQIVGWTEWTSCTPSCYSGGLVRKIIVCCPPSLGSKTNTTVGTCFSHCNISTTVITKVSGSSTKSSGGANTVRPSNSKTTGTPLGRSTTTSVGTVGPPSRTTIGANGQSHLSGNNTADTQSKSGPDGGVIAGALVGVLALAGLSSLLLFFLYRRWKKKKEESKVEPETKGDPNSTTNPTQQKSAPVPA